MRENLEDLLKTLSFWCFFGFSIGFFVAKTLIYVFLLICIFLFFFKFSLDYQQKKLNKKNTKFSEFCKEFLVKRKSLKILDLVILFYCLIDVLLAILVCFVTAKSGTEISKQSFLIEILKDRFFYFLLAWFSLSTIARGLSLKAKKKIISAFFCSGLFVSTFVISQFIFPELRYLKLMFLGDPSFGFHSGIFTNCALLILSSFVSLYFCLNSPFQKKNFQEFFLLCFLLHCLALVLIGQKSCILGILVGFLIWLILNWRKLSLNSRLILLAGFLITPSLMLLFYEPVRTTFLHMIKPDLDFVSYGCRTNLWKENFEDFLQDNLWQKIIGDGELIRSTCLNIKLAYAHNIFLQKLFVGGLISFFNLVTLLSVILIYFSRSKKDNQSIFAGLLALVLEGLFEDWISFSSILIVFVFYLSIFSATFTDPSISKAKNSYK